MGMQKEVETEFSEIFIKKCKKKTNVYFSSQVTNIGIALLKAAITAKLTAGMRNQMHTP